MSRATREAVVVAEADNGGIIHIANIKGGVGKTTVATNLAASLSRRGPTLIIDLDVQGSAGAALGRDIADNGRSSWELFRRRFGAEAPSAMGEKTLLQRIYRWCRRAEALVFHQFVGKGSVSDLITHVQTNLDLIPANAELFRNPVRFQIHNLLYNIRLLRHQYKYIVIDTPSVWNRITQTLYRAVDLNLIPVTLNALSTKSLRDYLAQVRSLARHHPGVRIRIVKNEVFGTQESKIKGKTRTMSENRRFLENLCEQVIYKSKHGFSSLPQSIIFDLEIPESASVLNAQDEGKLLADSHHYCAAARAFDELGKRVQYVLNMPALGARGVLEKIGGAVWVPRLAALAVVAFFFSFNKPVREAMAPRPVAPQELAIPSGGIFTHTFVSGESLVKYAKFAISWFRAAVPSQREVQEYADELVSVYNLTREENATAIATPDEVPAGSVISFFPPSNIMNPYEKELVPVYRYFMKLIKDDFTYVTGDWCERGTGGGQPHYGMDIAGKLSAQIVSPIDGEIVIKNDENAGHVAGVVKDNAVIFFCHLDKRFFKNGDPVHAGQVIGTIGMTGHTSGPHVHIGYAVRSQSRSDMSFGRYRYLVTDPKLFYYRQMFIANLANRQKK